MGFRSSREALAASCIAFILMLNATAKLGFTAQAQSVPGIATTTIADTVYRADGTAAAGTVLISWPAFSTSAGSSVPAGTSAVTLAAGGALHTQLVPNAGSTPMGSYYTVVYHLDDGSTTREYWVVPVSAATVSVSSLKSTVLPASVAMQTVSKQYVDTAIAAAVTGHPLDASPYVVKAGDTMIGPLSLPGDPTAPLQASDKSYVDTQVAGLAGGLGQKVSLAPQTTQIVTQPDGTQLAVNSLNGVQYASRYGTGAGGNGIANAASSASCAGGCELKVEQGYAPSEHVSLPALKDQTHVEDARGGSSYETFLNPQPLSGQGNNAARTIDLTSTASAQSVLAATGGSEIFSAGLDIKVNALAGGSNVFPTHIQGTVPYFKSTYAGLVLTGNNNTLGQHVLFSEQQNCYGVGDCLMGGLFMQASGGFRDDADEASHPFDRVFTEDPRVFTGTCASGCTAGATTLQIAPTAAAGTQGEGRYLIDTNPAKAITAGSITGAGPVLGRQPSALFAGTSFPVSVFLETAQTIPTQSNSINPGTVNVAIATGAVPAGFASNTAALPAASGVACISDAAVIDARPLNFETAAYTTVDASHLQLTLTRPHANGATIAVGGLCGFGLEQKVDTLNGIRQVFPVLGSDTPTSLLYAGGRSAIVGVQGLTSAFLNTSLVVASIARTANVVNVTLVSSPVDLNGLTLQVQNVADPSYNGSFTITSTGPNTLSYANSGPDSTSNGGTLSYQTGSYGLYPMAEVLSVYDPATKTVDGQMTLAANTVPWAPGDSVEQPHYFQEQIYDDTDFISQYTPRPMGYPSAGITYTGNNGAGLYGWQIANNDPGTSYLGNGGTHTPPSTGINIQGVWNRSMEMQAGESAVFDVHCNSHGCSRWNSGYDLFALDTGAGQDSLHYTPQTSTLTFNLRGSQYTFSPQSLTANSINVNTLTAGTVNGHFQGTIDAASLPVFAASGAAHQAGAVPDPGATPGTTRFLREDGTWSLPAATGGNPGAGSALVLPLAAGLMAEYPFTEGAGSVAHDASGQGNDATLGAGALAPAWNATGITFAGSQNVSLPASLNAAKTMIFAVYINPLGNAANHVASNPLLVSNTVSVAAFHFTLFAAYPGSSVGFVDSAFGPTLFNAGPVTDAPVTLSGFHTLAATLGTCGGGSATVDHLYVDGVEVPGYGIQGCSAGQQASGNLLLGASPSIWGANSSFQGEMHFAAFYSSELNAAQIASASALLKNAVVSRGAAVTTPRTLLTYPALHIAGDSITFGYPGLTPYSSLLSLDAVPAGGVTNWGISGLTVQAISGSEENRVGPLCSTITGPAVYAVFAGTNDFLIVPQATTQTVFATLTADIRKVKQAGCRVGVATMISRGGNGGGNNGAAFDTDKKAYNALILNQAKAAGADFLIDLAADPNLGADGASGNTTYFQADATHPTQTGQQEIARVFSNAYNYAFGHTRTSPAVVASSTYQMLSGDGAVSLTSSSAQAVTLPDCTGPSGAVYTLSNASGVAKTVTGQASQPVNGLVSAISIPANSSLTLYDVPNPEAVSGCHWEY